MASNAEAISAARAAMQESAGLDMDSLLDMESEGWNPIPGEKLTGMVLTVGRCDCGGFGAHPLLEIQSDEGRILAVHGFHEVLRNAIERWEPKSGEVVGIKYNGKVTGRGEFGGYESYRMIVQR